MFGRLLRHIKQSIPGGHPFLAFNPVIKSDHPETVCSVQTHGPYLGEEQDMMHAVNESGSRSQRIRLDDIVCVLQALFRLETPWQCKM